MVSATIICKNSLIDNDINFIKKHAKIITSLDLTSHDYVDDIVTQSQVDNIINGTTKFPRLDSLSISNNRDISSLNLKNLPKLTKLYALRIHNITGFNRVKNQLTALEISEVSRISPNDIKSLSKLTVLALHEYSNINSIDLSKLTNLTDLTINQMYKVTTLIMSVTACKITNITVTNLNTLTKIYKP